MSESVRRGFRFFESNSHFLEKFNSETLKVPNPLFKPIHLLRNRTDLEFKYYLPFCCLVPEHANNGGPIFPFHMYRGKRTVISDLI